MRSLSLQERLWHSVRRYSVNEALAQEEGDGFITKWEQQVVSEPQPKIADGDAKPESQSTPDERRVVVQDQHLKSIIMSCLPNDIMESVISCVSAKETWTDLVYSFEGPSDTKKNRIIDLKLEYQTFKEKSTKSFSQTYTRCKTLLNELANDGVNHLNMKSTLDFQENSDDEVNERSSEEYLRELDIEYQERALLENSKLNNYSSVSKGFQPKFTPKLIQSSSNLNSQADPKFQKDYKAKYKKMKAKLALLEASPSSFQNPKNFQPKNKGLLVKTFDWDKEEIFDEEEVSQVKVLMALADDELTVGNNHARNDEWVDITIITSLESTEILNTPESSKDSEAESLTLLPPLKNLQGSFTKLRETTLNVEFVEAMITLPQDTIVSFRSEHIREPIWYLDSGCSRSMTGVKSYLHKYVEQPGPKVVFGDNSSCITEGYGSINCGGVVSTKVAFVNGLKYNLISISQFYDAKYIIQFDDKQGTIFNANKEIVLIAPRRNDVYVLDMSSLTPNGA
ncbi:hypothetical protein Tco_0774239 [Tanacetum coccineum]|uniref:Retrovirus-related Pol polyprotein from transposon TNT 1-94-like beta-barrel domain-containing protein n=1 Tax=Tanacetum coccineum TaxID=301880 RepID=A0ABQ4ZMY7_9ASTR